MNITESGMKKMIYVLIFFLLWSAVFIIALFGASGHHMNFRNPDNMKFAFISVLHLFTSISLIIFVRTYNSVVKWLAISGLVLTAGSICYLLYRTFPIGGYDDAIFVPISILIGMSVLCGFILYQLVFKRDGANDE
ncbi:MAG: hypothetical protein V4594_17930 [Bacteroidota bacterium]